MRIESDKSSKSIEIEGYIYKTHVSFIENWKEIKNEGHNNIGRYSNDSLKISINKTIFQPQKHNLFYSKEVPGISVREIIKIDDNYFWGTDGEIPKEKISSLTISVNKKRIAIPVSAYNDLFEPLLKTVSISQTSNIFYLSMSNSDGAGAYIVIWIFKDYKYYGRYIDDDNE